MTPAVPQAEIEAMVKQVDRLTDRYNRLTSQLGRAIKYYDECPDGDPRKTEAVASMHSISDRKHTVEEELSKLVDKLIDLGVYE
jgi:regulator of sigma D